MSSVIFRTSFIGQQNLDCPPVIRIRMAVDQALLFQGQSVYMSRGLPCTCVLPYDGGGINILYPLHQLIVYVWIAHFLNIAIDKDIHLCIIICTKSERVQ